MKKNLFLLILLFVSALITSCKDDKNGNESGINNSAAEITSFTFDSIKVENDIVSTQPIINRERKEIKFTVSNSATDIEISALMPTIKLSLGATVTPESGVAPNFNTTDTVKYVVTSKDALVKAEYSVICTRDSANIGDELNDIFYKGTLDIQLGGDPVGADIPQKIFITKTGENIIRMELNNFSFEGINIGNILVDGIKVVKMGVNYTFIGSQSITLPVSPEPCDVSVEGTINGDAMEMDITVIVPAIGSVIVDFKGDKMLVNQSSEAKITSFTFADPDTIINSKPMITGSNIIFYVSTDATEAQIKALVPTIEISENATIIPEIDSVVDFNNIVHYTVVSEDEIYTTKYSVSIGGSTMKYHFEDWEGEGDGSDLEYMKPVGWGTSNSGIIVIKTMFSHLYSGGAIIASTNGTDGMGAEIKTANTTGAASIIPGVFPAVPKITTGSLFTGEFIVDILNTLKSTKFGLPYTLKPTSVKGFFKYTPGAEYFVCKDPVNASEITELDPTQVDECALSAVLYEVTSYEDKSQTLTGEDIFTSDKIVAIAQKFSGKKVNFEEFELILEYKKTYDPTKKYKFAMIFSSSKNGDKFSGAPESTLVIDEVEVINE